MWAEHRPPKQCTANFRATSELAGIVRGLIFRLRYAMSRHSPSESSAQCMWPNYAHLLRVGHVWLGVGHTWPKLDHIWVEPDRS